MNFYLLSLIKAAVVVGVLMLMLLVPAMDRAQSHCAHAGALGPNRVGPLACCNPSRIRSSCC